MMWSCPHRGTGLLSAYKGLKLKKTDKCVTDLSCLLSAYKGLKQYKNQVKNLDDEIVY